MRNHDPEAKLVDVVADLLDRWAKFDDGAIVGRGSQGEGITVTGLAALAKAREPAGLDFCHDVVAAAARTVLVRNKTKRREM